MTRAVTVHTVGQRQAVTDLATGMTPREVAQKRGVATDALYAMLKRIREFNEIGTQTQMLERAREFGVELKRLVRCGPKRCADPDFRRPAPVVQGAARSKEISAREAAKRAALRAEMGGGR